MLSDAVWTSKREVSVSRCTATAAWPSRMVEPYESLRMDRVSAAGARGPHIHGSCAAGKQVAPAWHIARSLHAYLRFTSVFKLIAPRFPAQ
jgi:hypothetical protein